MQTPKISIVVALGKNGDTYTALGKDNALLWRISDDLKRFKALTLGHPIIMGRKTFESIGKPLPGRTNIIVTRDSAWSHEGVTTVHSVEEGIAYAKTLDDSEIFIGGGAQIYTQALPLVDKLYLTLIEDEKEADSFFPEFREEFTKETFREDRVSPEGIHYTWIDLERA